MLTTRRLAAVVCIASASLLFVTPSALASGWGNAQCDQVPSPACQLGAGTSGDNKPPAQPGESPGRRGGAPQRSGGDRTGAAAPHRVDTVYDDPDLSHCSYTKSDFQPPAGGAVTISYLTTPPRGSVVDAVSVRPAHLLWAESSAAVVRLPALRPAGLPGQVEPPDQGAGAWYEWRCHGNGEADAVYRPPVWIADGHRPGAAAQPPSAQDVAALARRQLRFPTPSILASPTGDQLVGLPTWMWLAGGWAPVTATATVPGVSVTATATPTSVVWSMGDGATVTCAGPGTPYPAGTDPTAASPDCGHLYHSSSAGQPGQKFPVSATIHWMVTWAGAGQGGRFPDLITTGATGFRVAEAQALNGGG